MRDTLEKEYNKKMDVFQLELTMQLEELQRKLEKSERINEKFEPELNKWKLRNAFLKLNTCLWAGRAPKWAESRSIRRERERESNTCHGPRY